MNRIVVSWLGVYRNSAFIKATNHRPPDRQPLSFFSPNFDANIEADRWDASRAGL
jgi:hypothetical protein